MAVKAAAAALTVAVAGKEEVPVGDALRGEEPEEDTDVDEEAEGTWFGGGV